MSSESSILLFVLHFKVEGKYVSYILTIVLQNVPQSKVKIGCPLRWHNFGVILSQLTLNYMLIVKLGC